MLSVQQVTCIPVTVVEVCFNDAALAPEIAARIIREHPASIRAILTSSSLDPNGGSGTSVLHIHVLTDRLGDFLVQHPCIKDSGGAMMITTPSAN